MGAATITVDPINPLKYVVTYTTADFRYGGLELGLDNFQGLVAATADGGVTISTPTIVATTYRQSLALDATFALRFGTAADPLTVSIDKAAISGSEAAHDRLQAKGLADDASDAVIAAALFTTADQAEYGSAKLDRDRIHHYDSIKPVKLEYKNSVLDLQIKLKKAFTGDVDLKVNLDDLPGLGAMLSNDTFGINLITNGKAHVDADMAFDLDFSFDLRSLGDPKFIIRDGSSITFNKLDIQTLEPIDITASLVVGGAEIATLAIIGATISTNLTGTVSLVEDPTDHQYLASELARNKALWNVDLLGSVRADLPMFFPSPSMPLGGSSADGNNDGFADNVLHADGTFRGKNDYTLNFAAPKLSLSSLGSLFALLNDPELESLVMLKLEGYTNDEIAEKLGYTRRTIQRMLNLVRDAWKDQTDGSE